MRYSHRKEEVKNLCRPTESLQYTPQILLNLEIIASTRGDPLQCLLLKSSSFLPFLIHHHTMRNNNSGSICLGSQSSDGTDATGTFLWNTHWSDYSKVRLLYLYLCNSRQSTEFSLRCVNPSAPYPTASPFSYIQLFHHHLHFSARHNHSWVFQPLVLPNQVY